MAQDYARVQAPEIAGPEPLRPPGLPGDTFTGAPRPIQDENLARIADALGSFNTNLQHYGLSAARLQKHQARDQEQAMLNQEIAGRTREQWAGAVEKGEIPNFQDPVVRAASDKYYGQTRADLTIQDLEKQRLSGQLPLVGPDPSHPAPNVGDLITQRSNQDLSTIGIFKTSGPAFLGYRDKLNSYRDQMEKQQLVAREQQQTTFNEGIATDTFNKVLNQPMEADQAVSTIRQVYKELGPSLVLKPGRMDDLLMDVLKNRAADPQQAERALAVLRADREDINTGSKMPSLAANPRFAAQAQDIYTSATQALSTKFKDDTTQLAEANALQALKAKDGSYWGLTDTSVTNPIPRKPGDTTNPQFTVSADAARKAAVTNFLTQSAQQQSAQKESNDVRFEREWDVMTSNNVSHPVWKDQLEGAAHALTSTSALTDPNQRQTAIQAGELFMKMSERNYPYAKELIGKDKTALDTWTVYQTLRNELGYSPDRALDMAGQANRAPQNEDDDHVRAQKAKDITDKVKSLDWGSGFSSYFPFVNDTASNVSEVQRRVGEVASVMTRVPGISQDDAVKYAMDAVSKRSMIIHGYVVPETGTQPTQAQKPYIENLLDKAFEQHGKDWEGASSSSDLTVKPAGGGNFLIVNKSDGFGHPVYVTDKAGKVVPAMITQKMIQQSMQTDKEVATGMNTVNSAKARDAALVTTPDQFLSPQAIARKGELLQQSRQGTDAAIQRRINEAAMVGPGTPELSRHQMDLMADGIKHGASRASEALGWLGGVLKNHAVRMNESINQLGDIAQ